jgi:hypothetical protein
MDFASAFETNLLSGSSYRVLVEGGEMDWMKIGM